MNRLKVLTGIAFLFMAGVSQLFALAPDSLFIKRLKRIEKQVSLEVNEDVMFAINKRMYDDRKASEDMLGRSVELFPFLEKEFASNGIPLEMKHLTVALSGLNPLRLNGHGGAGLWELQYITARRYGLTVNEYIDERKDVKKSTSAAISYLKDLHKLYNDWTLVVMAFVTSPAELNGSIGRAGGKHDIWKIYENMNDPGKFDFVEFIAATYLVNYYADYGLTKKAAPAPPVCVAYTVDQRMDLSLLANQIGISDSELLLLNPTLRTSIIPGEFNFQLNIPSAQAALYDKVKGNAVVMADKKNHSTYQAPEVTNPFPTNNSAVRTNSNVSSNDKDKVIHKVVSGETLYKISNQYNVSIADIKEWNNLQNDIIQVGQNLAIHKEKSEVETNYVSVNSNENTSNPVNKNTSTTSTKSKSTSVSWITYRVKSGDSVYRIANKYNISEDQLRKNNNLSSNLIHPGQVLKIKKS